MKKKYLSPQIKKHPLSLRTALLTVSGGVGDDNKLDNQSKDDPEGGESMGSRQSSNVWGSGW